MFFASPDFRNSMKWNTYQYIQKRFHLHSDLDHNIVYRDPSCHSPSLLDHFWKSSAEFAVPTTVTSFDENTISCKGWTSANIYTKSKPIKFDISLYGNIGLKSIYLDSISNNSSGNNWNFSSPYRPVPPFGGSVVPWARMLMKRSNRAKALLHYEHDSKLHIDRKWTPSRRTLCCMGQFLNTSMPCKQIRWFTNGETLMPGPVRLKNLDMANGAKTIY